MELVAHRAGNDRALVGPAVAVADVIELDVHSFRGRLDVRHSKAIWPFAVYWEAADGILAGEHPPSLASILAVVPAEQHVWIDLKGFTGSFTKRVLRELGDRRRVTMSCRTWWALRPAEQQTGVRTFRSVANRWQLWLSVRLRHPDGVAMHERFATADTLARLHRRCSAVAVWAVTDLDRAVELAGLGVSTLIVDDLALISAIRERSTPGDCGDG